MSPSKNITLVALASAMLSACSTQAPSSIYTHPSFEAGNRQLAIEVISKGETSSGSAAWIEPGIALTAAHLFLGASKSSTIRVGNGRTWGNAEIIAIDDPAYRDLAILKVDQDILASLAPPTKPVKLCETSIRPGQEVLVASGLTRTVSSSYASPEMTSHSNGDSWAEHLTGYYASGTSGAAVYDAESGCLGGVISKRRKTISNSDLQIYSTEFVSLPQILDFLDSHLRKSH